jgi:hypothetical protein
MGCVASAGFLRDARESTFGKRQGSAGTAFARAQSAGRANDDGFSRLLGTPLSAGTERIRPKVSEAQVAGIALVIAATGARPGSCHSGRRIWNRFSGA